MFWKKKNPEDENINFLSDRILEIGKLYPEDVLNSIEKSEKEFYLQRISYLLVSRGNIYCERGDFQKAIPDFEKAIDIKHDCLPAFLGIALAYGAQGNFIDAKKITKRAPETMKINGEIVCTKTNFFKESLQELPQPFKQIIK